MKKFDALYKKLYEEIEHTEVVPSLESLADVTSAARTWHLEFSDNFNPKNFESTLDPEKRSAEERLALEKMKGSWDKIEPIIRDAENAIVALEKTYEELQKLYNDGLLIAKGEKTTETPAQ